MDWKYALITLFFLLIAVIPLSLLILLEFDVLPLEYHKTVVVNQPQKEIQTQIIVQNVTKEIIVQQQIQKPLPESNVECVRIYKPEQKNSNTYELMCTKK
jgi:hypothetical protein